MYRTCTGTDSLIVADSRLCDRTERERERESAAAERVQFPKKLFFSKTKFERQTFLHVSGCRTQLQSSLLLCFEQTASRLAFSSRTLQDSSPPVPANRPGRTAHRKPQKVFADFLRFFPCTSSSLLLLLSLQIMTVGCSARTCSGWAASLSNLFIYCFRPSFFVAHSPRLDDARGPVERFACR